MFLSILEANHKRIHIDTNVPVRTLVSVGVLTYNDITWTNGSVTVVLDREDIWLYRVYTSILSVEGD